MSGAAVLHIIGGNDRGKQHDLERPETRIGRGTDQDVVLADIAVSRRHVTILTEGQRFRLKDLGSGNGSLVNGQRVDTVILNDGDQIEIGNTLMRFDHAASRPATAGAPPMLPPPMGQPAPPAPSAAGLAGGYPGSGSSHPQPSYPQNAYGAPPPAYPQGYPPSGYPPPPQYPPIFGPDASGPGHGANAPIGITSGAAPSYSPPVGVRGRDAASFISTPTGKAAVFGGLGLVSLIGLVIILTRTVFAAAPPTSNEAEDFYRQGLRLFAAGDYELARTKFNDVVQLAADAPEPRRYARLCDQEMTAKTSLKNAERALVNRRYVEAVRALDAVDSTSVYYDQASRQRREAAPKAAAEMVDEARRLATVNPDEARGRLKAALELDPDSIDGKELLARLRPGGAAAPSGPPPSAATVAAVSRPPAAAASSHKTSAHHAAKGEDDLADVKPSKDRTPAASASVDSKAGMAAYKARDFAGAQKAYRQESMHQPEKQAAKMIDFANQIGQLQQLIDRAGTDEAKQPSQAMKEYEQASSLDQKLSHGALSGFLKQKMGGLGVVAAKQSFADGKYEQAYQAAQAAQRGGSDASGLMKQLEQKASELVTQGQSQQKSNLNQAKQTWRTVLKMVPGSSPSYTKAYGLLNSASAPKRDEDED